MRSTKRCEAPSLKKKRQNRCKPSSNVKTPTCTNAGHQKQKRNRSDQCKILLRNFLFVCMQSSALQGSLLVAAGTDTENRKKREINHRSLPSRYRETLCLLLNHVQCDKELPSIVLTIWQDAHTNTFFAFFFRLLAYTCLTM
jgi:hypothetical protein